MSPAESELFPEHCRELVDTNGFHGFGEPPAIGGRMHDEGVRGIHVSAGGMKTASGLGRQRALYLDGPTPPVTVLDQQIYLRARAGSVE